MTRDLKTGSELGERIRDPQQATRQGQRDREQEQPRANEQPQVEPEADVLDIILVADKFLTNTFQVHLGWKVNLSQSCNARPDLEAIRVALHLVLQNLDNLRALGPWADQAHFTAE